MDQEVGKVIHYFDKAGVAVMKLSGYLAVGDQVKIKKGGNEFTQDIESMEIDRKSIQSAEAGKEVAVKVTQAAKEGSRVYRLEA
ncbi:hypothetical protein HYW53_03505 [Candidatus Giovannonibacteria bacterium]|nr:hypothetical protein [Candidatus Giovannonibacteria bacterium]